MEYLCHMSDWNAKCVGNESVYGHCSQFASSFAIHKTWIMHEQIVLRECMCISGNLTAGLNLGHGHIASRSSLPSALPYLVSECINLCTIGYKGNGKSWESFWFSACDVTQLQTIRWRWAPPISDRLSEVLKRICNFSLNLLFVTRLFI